MRKIKSMVGRIISIEYLYLKLAASFLCCVVLMIFLWISLGGVCYELFEKNYRSQWESSWLDKLSKYKNVNDILTIRDGPKPATVAVRNFQDKTWVVIVTTDTHRRSFDAALLYDSNNNSFLLDPERYDSVKFAVSHFFSIEAESLEEFLRKAYKLKLIKFQKYNKYNFIFQITCNCWWSHPIKTDEVELKIEKNTTRYRHPIN